MKRKITFLLAALLLMSGLTWAQTTINWTASEQGYQNAQEITSVTFDNNVSGTFAKGTSNNTPKYYNTGAAIRCYGGNFFTITSDYVLTEISFGFATGEGSNAITSNVGTYENGTWTGSANEVTFTIGGTSGHRRFATFTITYDEGDNPAPSITADNVEIAYDATEGAIEYTINNGVEGGVLTAATEAEWLTLGTVGETVPFTSTVNDNGERVATVTLTYTYNTDQTVTKNVTVTQATNPNGPGSEANPYTVAQAIAAIDAGAGTQGVYATGIVSAIPTAYNANYGNITFDIVDASGDQEYLRAYRCVGDEAANVAIGDVVVVYGNLTYYANGGIYEFGQGCQVVSLEHPVITEPTITVTPATFNVDVEEHDGTLALAYENLTITAMGDFDIQYYDAEGEELTENPAWIEALVAEQDPAVGEGYVVSYMIEANDGEARTAYFKVYAMDDESNLVYSNLVTVNQEAYVAPTYAALPFEFNGGKADIENTDGLYQEGLGTDYNATNNPNTQLKFDGTGDWLLLQFSERPGILTFDIKGNSFSGGTFTVQTSEDGETYEDLAAYTELGDVETKTFDNLGENVRYIKWIYTEKSNGNVGLGNITLAEYVEPVIVPVVTVTPDNVTAPYTSGQGLGEFTITVENINNPNGSWYRFFDPANPETPADTNPEWIDLLCSFDEAEGTFSLLYDIDENNGYEARTACFKYVVFYPEGENSVPVMSNLITLTQEAYVAPVASITVEFDGIEVTATGEDDYAAITYENLEITQASDFDIQFYDAEGTELTENPDWIAAEVTTQIGEEGYFVYYVIKDNEGEARTAYFKVYALNANAELVYSNLVTVTQEAYVAPVLDYATLPFEFDGGRADIETTDGLTQEGLDSDYGSSPKLKFNTTGDWMLLHFNEEPGELAFDIKGNSFSGGTFTVQTSVDGETYENLATYSELGNTEHETFNTLAADVRYIKWIYTQKVSGNVALGNITLAQPAAPVASITVDPAEVNATVEGGEGTLNVTYTNITEILAEVYFCDAEGEAATYDWITAYIYYEDNNVYYTIEANYGEARTAYLKVYALDDNGNEVYSNLVTINQDAYVGASITVETTEVNATAAATTGTFNVTGFNVDMDYTWVEFCTVDGDYASYDWVDAEVINDGENYYISYTIEANGGAARTAYFKVGGQDNVFQDWVYSDIVTVNQAASSVSWVLTDFADLMEGDMFVIVGTRTDAYAGDYALPSSYGGYAAPAAVAINVENNALTTEPDTDLQWFLNFTEDGSYVFYPVIYSYEMWLYCTNTNNGVRVGYGNGNNAFVMEDGYLKNVATSRYVGIYNAQDWRCYTNTTGNIANQTFSFYKKVVEPETYTLDINGYGENEGGYCLIASPVYVNPETTGMTQGDFDLYWFDQNQGDEWRNYEAQNYNLVPGKGYLYANSQDVTLTFTGTPYSGDGTVKLVNNDNADLAGWNLVGNPFGETAYIDRDYYTMNEDGSGIIAANERNYSVEPMQGIFVIAAYDGEEMTFSTESGATEGSNVVINVTTNRGTIDRAIVRFGEGRQLPKFQINAESTKLYIPQGTEDFAVVRSTSQNEMPVNFKAKENGSYTISVSTENLNVAYLHLIDNRTSADIDLLLTPSYTFEANAGDNANRFRLVFNVNNGIDDNTVSSNASFAYFNGSEWVISNTGNATLQVVDMMGRVLSTETINGNATVKVNQVAGIYMLRLVNGNDVKVQKMVVK